MFNLVAKKVKQLIGLAVACRQKHRETATVICGLGVLFFIPYDATRAAAAALLYILRKMEYN